MSISHTAHRTLLKAFTLALCSLFAGAPLAQAAVSLDQSPLIIQKPIPPNLVLMLDDSGSMAWDYMPDWNYLASNTGTGPVTSSVNGVYYDPTVTYIPPTRADGTAYPSYDSTFPKAPVNGFNPGTSSSYQDITAYQSPYASFKYYYTPLDTESGTYSCQSQTLQSSKYPGYCYSSKSNLTPAYTFYDKDNGYYYYAGLCSSSTGSCIKGNVFRYGISNGNTYTTHYVSPSGCGNLSNCVTASDTSGTAAPVGITAGTNIANWFAYYHTRILMAQTGLTLAFSGLDKNYRFGFGSINGRNTARIPSSPTPFSFSTPTQTSNQLASVTPFGDGSTGTQKSNFWNWITTISPNNGTPLRSALKAVGEYYKTAQPWQTSVTDQTEYTCRPAYTILTTDGFWNTDFDSTINVGNVDGNDGPKITTPSNYQRIAAQPYSDTYSNTLADVAMQYWQEDLRPTLGNEVPATPSDPAFWQHMTTFTMGLGFAPTGITPSTLTYPEIFGWARTGTPPSGVTNMTWPQPAADSINNIADLLHAAVNGHGDFFSAKNPADFVNGLKSALAQIQDRKGAGNAITLSASSATVSSGSVYRFLASYYTGQWTGSLTAETWDDATQTYSPAWTVNTVFPSAANRNIWTMNRLASTANPQSPIAFTLGSTNTLPAMDATLLGGLDYYVNGVKQAKTREAMLTYLRGDNSDTTLRQRKAVLGDVISSTPVYVASPDNSLYVNATFPGASSYGAFVAAKVNRTPLVYVAANDGMLHAFRVKQGYTNNILDPNKPAGQEIFAYLPGGVLAKAANSPAGISNLANPQYGVVDGVTGNQTVPHQYYNDGRITVQEVYLNGAWKTILIGTTGRGPAKTVYAMDITNPQNFESGTTTANNILWERSAADTGTCEGTITSGCSDYIGQMTGAPVIAQIKDGTSTKWAVLLGNGYNSTANTPALLQFDLTTGALNVRTTTGSTNDGLAEPGLMQPDVKTGITTRAFAGDLNGNVWSFDLTSSTGAGTKVFQAKDASNVAQPITSLISLSYDTKTDSSWAFFGTGRYLAYADVASTQVQTWYGLRVATDVTTTPLPSVVSSSTVRTDLVQRSILAETNAGNGNLLRATSPAQVNDMNGKLGWYMDLSTQTGERIINRTQFIGGMAVVTTMIPKVSDPCNTVPSGAVMMVNPFTGGNFASDIGLGTTSVKINNVNTTVPFNGMVYTVGPAAGVTGSYDKTGKIMLQFNNLSGNPVQLGPISGAGAAAGRVSWRELSN